MCSLDWVSEIVAHTAQQCRASIWGRIKPFFTFFRLNKGSKCCTRGFPWGEQNAAQGVFWGRKRGFPGSPTLRSKKFRLRRQKSRLRRNLSILRANAAQKKGKFYDAKNATRKTRGFPGSRPEQGVFLSSLLSAKTLHKGSSRNPNRSLSYARSSIC